MVLLSGAAWLRFEGEAAARCCTRRLSADPGSIAGTGWNGPIQRKPTVWLALHF